MDVYKVSSSLIFVIIGILSLIKEGLCIECYTCNSHIQKACAKFSSMSVEARKPYIVKCWQLEDAPVKNYTMCRKITQDVEGDKRTIRQCATAGNPGHPCIKRTGTRRIKMEYCECDKDLCNSAPRRLRLPIEIAGLVFLCSVVLFPSLLVR